MGILEGKCPFQLLVAFCTRLNKNDHERVLEKHGFRSWLGRKLKVDPECGGSERQAA